MARNLTLAAELSADDSPSISSQSFSSSPMIDRQRASRAHSHSSFLILPPFALVESISPRSLLTASPSQPLGSLCTSTLEQGKSTEIESQCIEGPRMQPFRGVSRPFSPLLVSSSCSPRPLLGGWSGERHSDPVGSGVRSSLLESSSETFCPPSATRLGNRVELIPDLGVRRSRDEGRVGVYKVLSRRGRGPSKLLDSGGVISSENHCRALTERLDRELGSAVALET